MAILTSAPEKIVMKKLDPIAAVLDGDLPVANTIEIATEPLTNEEIAEMENIFAQFNSEVTFDMLKNLCTKIDSKQTIEQ